MRVIQLDFVRYYLGRNESYDTFLPLLGLGPLRKMKQLTPPKAGFFDTIGYCHTL